jgi:hypothetical protein
MPLQQQSSIVKANALARSYPEGWISMSHSVNDVPLVVVVDGVDVYARV